VGLLKIIWVLPLIASTYKPLESTFISFFVHATVSYTHIPPQARLEPIVIVTHIPGLP